MPRPLKSRCVLSFISNIQRSQLWQWVKHKARTAENKTVTADWVKRVIDDEVDKIRKTMGEQKFAQTKFERAKDYLWATSQGKEYAEFLTTQMYDDLVKVAPGSKSKL
jgi:malate synthase